MPPKRQNSQRNYDDTSKKNNCDLKPNFSKPTIFPGSPTKLPPFNTNSGSKLIEEQDVSSCAVQVTQNHKHSPQAPESNQTLNSSVSSSSDQSKNVDCVPKLSFKDALMSKPKKTETYSKDTELFTGVFNENVNNTSNSDSNKPTNQLNSVTEIYNSSFNPPSTQSSNSSSVARSGVDKNRDAGKANHSCSPPSLPNVTLSQTMNEVITSKAIRSDNQCFNPSDVREDEQHPPQSTISVKSPPLNNEGVRAKGRGRGRGRGRGHYFQSGSPFNTKSAPPSVTNINGTLTPTENQAITFKGRGRGIQSPYETSSINHRTTSETNHATGDCRNEKRDHQNLPQSTNEVKSPTPKNQGAVSKKSGVRTVNISSNTNNRVVTGTNHGDCRNERYNNQNSLQSFTNVAINNGDCTNKWNNHQNSLQSNINHTLPLTINQDVISQGNSNNRAASERNRVIGECRNKRRDRQNPSQTTNKVKSSPQRNQSANTKGRGRARGRSKNSSYDTNHVENGSRNKIKDHCIPPVSNMNVVLPEKRSQDWIIRGAGIGRGSNAASSVSDHKVGDRGNEGKEHLSHTSQSSINLNPAPTRKQDSSLVVTGKQNLNSSSEPKPSTPSVANHGVGDGRDEDVQSPTSQFSTSLQSLQTGNQNVIEEGRGNQNLSLASNTSSDTSSAVDDRRNEERDHPNPTSQSPTSLPSPETKNEKVILEETDNLESDNRISSVTNSDESFCGIWEGNSPQVINDHPVNGPAFRDCGNNHDKAHVETSKAKTKKTRKTKMEQDGKSQRTLRSNAEKIKKEQEVIQAGIQKLKDHLQDNIKHLAQCKLKKISIVPRFIIESRNRGSKRKGKRKPMECIEELFVDIDAPKKILVIGNPGFGKTTLCLKVSQIITDRDKIVFYTTSQEVEGITSDITQYFINYYASQLRIESSLLQLVFENYTKDVVVVIEDYDAMSISAKKHVVQFLSTSQCCVILTSRFTRDDDVLCKHFDTRVTIRCESVPGWFKSNCDKNLAGICEYLFAEIPQTVFNFSSKPNSLPKRRGEGKTTLFDCLDFGLNMKVKELLEAEEPDGIVKKNLVNFENCFLKLGFLFFEALCEGHLSFSEQCLKSALGDDFDFIISCNIFHFDRGENSTDAFRAHSKLLLVFFAAKYLRNLWSKSATEKQKLHFMQNVICMKDCTGDYLFTDSERSSLYFVGLLPEIVINFGDQFCFHNAKVEMYYDTQGVELSKSFSSLNLLIRLGKRHLSRFMFSELPQDDEEIQTIFEQFLNALYLPDMNVEYEMYLNTYEDMHYLRIFAKKPESDTDVVFRSVCGRSRSRKVATAFVEISIKALDNVIEFLNQFFQHHFPGLHLTNMCSELPLFDFVSNLIWGFLECTIKSRTTVSFYGNNLSEVGTRNYSIVFGFQPCSKSNSVTACCYNFTPSNCTIDKQSCKKEGFWQLMNTLEPNLQELSNNTEDVKIAIEIY